MLHQYFFVNFVFLALRSRPNSALLLLTPGTAEPQLGTLTFYLLPPHLQSISKGDLGVSDISRIICV